MPPSTIAPAHEYQVACFCALQPELDAITAMLDEEHEGSPPLSELSQNAYTFGRIGEHRIVITTTTRCGNNLAAAVATQLVNDFPRIKFCFLVGIGGGVPDERRDIRLGDVVVSTPNSQSAGVVQYDLGKLLPEERFERSPRSNEPPRILTGYSSRLRARGEQRLWMQMLDHLKDMNKKRPDMAQRFAFPGEAKDRLFKATYQHRGGITCADCLMNDTQLIHRQPRSDHLPRVHFGTIGSANAVVRDGVIRDRLKHEIDMMCVEMEAAGIQNSFPGLVIRGISDYADSHKNDDWQPYAAAMAAAYMKALLLSIPAPEVTHVAFSAAERVEWPTIALNRPLSRPQLEDILQRKADNFRLKLNWRDSIVDLLKLLDQNSSPRDRDALAARLGVSAGSPQSLERNMALHRAVMEELEKNHGTICPPFSA